MVHALLCFLLALASAKGFQSLAVSWTRFFACTVSALRSKFVVLEDEVGADGVEPYEVRLVTFDCARSLRPEAETSFLHLALLRFAA